MEQLIGKLIAIDKEARARVSKAKKERAKALETVDTQRREMEETYRRELDALIERERVRAEETKQAALCDIEQSKQTLISGLDALFEEKSDVWVAALVERVLGAQSQ